jgi:hypothetical protein
LTPNIGSNARSNVPFIDGAKKSYMSVGMRMFKDSSLMVKFPLPPAPPSTNIALVPMISSFTSGSLGSFNPWVVPHPKDIESYGASMPPTVVDIVDPKIPSTSVDTSQQLHPYMECDPPTSLIWIFDSSCSHDFLDTRHLCLLSDLISTRV